jgi:hypothetical protein
MYAKDKHNVLEVGGADFRACNPQANRLYRLWNAGDDVVRLDKAERRWFICGVPGHCDTSMKLLVNVLAATAPAPVRFSIAGAMAVAVLAF